MILPENWAEIFLPTLRDIYTLSAGKERDYIAEIYNRQKSDLAAESTLGMGELGLMDDWEDTDGQTSYEDVDKGWKTTYTHKKYSKGVQVKREWLEDNQYDKVATHIKDLRKVGYNTQQSHGVSLFNNAWNGDTDWLLADSKPLASTTHTYNADGTGGYFVNAGTYELSAANLELIRTYILTSWKDDKGNLLNIDPDDFMLLVPSALRKTALIINGSEGEPDMSDNNINVWHGSIDVVEWARLTDTNAFFVIVRPQGKKLLHWFDRRPLGIDTNTHFDSEVLRTRTIGRWDFGSDCPPAWVYCSNPS